MEIWAYIGFAVVVAMAFIVIMTIINKAAIRFNLVTSWAGGLLITTAMAYASYVTWIVTTGNIPFVTSGG